MSPVRNTTRTGTRGYAHLVELEVPVARVWRALTDPGLMRIWSAQDAEIDARKGGLYRLGRRQQGAREAHIDIFDMNRRLRLIYLKDPALPPSESAVVDDFLLDVRRVDLTTLRLLGSGVSDAAEWDRAYVRMRQGWERLLGRIKFTLESPPPAEKPPPPPKDPGLPGLDY